MNATLTLRNDYLFKRLLGAEENKACLQDFLECAGIPHYNYLKIMHTAIPFAPLCVFLLYSTHCILYPDILYFLQIWKKNYR